MATTPLIRALCDPCRYPHSAETVQVLETHISWVLLTGPFAYKIKKPVDLGFLDFSRLQQRRFYCQEELRLNRRFAPQLYLEVLGIGGTPENPRLGAAEAAFEYALKMVQFPPGERLDRVLERGEFSPALCDLLAEEMAHCHATAAVAGDDVAFGDYDVVHAPVEETFGQMTRRLGETAPLARLSDWCRQTHARRRADFVRRKTKGCVRECHGDLHLENMVRLDGRVALFDCLEFSERLRWIDVASDLAFVLMDLAYRRRPDLGNRLLNACLEATGDHDALTVLRYYLVYRALVRASVSCIRAHQDDLPAAERPAVLGGFERHLQLAEAYTRPAAPFLAITHGPSGSGKSSYTQALLEAAGAIRIRSDVERKRLFGLSPAAPSGANAAELYSQATTVRTYERLTVLAQAISEAGYPVIVDATNLRHAQRQLFCQLAERQRVPFVILDFQAPEAVLRERVQRRERAGQDASEATVAVLEQQLHSREALTGHERAASIAIEAGAPLAIEATIERIRRSAPPNIRS